MEERTVSKKAVNDFIEQAAKDKKLRTAIRGHVDHIVAVARENGHKFTKKELASVMRERWEKKGKQAPHFCDYFCEVCY
jgi:hypothetical protein